MLRVYTGVMMSSSWRIGVGASCFLNPPLFIREVCGLSAPDEPWRGATPWPPAYLADQLTPAERAAARQAWPHWWADMLALACAESACRRAEHGPLPDRRQRLDPPDFGSLEAHRELRKACQVAWGPYWQWWQMPAGGRMALEAGFEQWHGRNGTVQRVVKQFERRHGRRARSFALDIELVYPQTDDVHDGRTDFAVLGSAWLVRGDRFEAWLAARVAMMA